MIIEILAASTALNWETSDHSLGAGMSEHKILFIGDFYHGESYSPVRREILAQRGYRWGTRHLEPFLDDADHVVVNLETPIVDPEKYPSPYKDEKQYVHWSDPRIVPKTLSDLGVDAVSLANNHTLDHGEQGLLETLNHLSEYDIAVFGAGRNISEAAVPHRIELPQPFRGAVNVHGMYEYREHYDRDFAFYADEDAAGCNPLHDSLDQMFPVTLEQGDFNVAFPHWGANYRWPRGRQLRQRRPLTQSGYDVVIGHGSHCLQGLTLRDGVPVLYGIGNGVFQSPGRFAHYVEEYGILPFGAWVMLRIQALHGRQFASVNVYPVYADNRLTDFQPKPVEHVDFVEISRVLSDAVPRLQSRGLELTEDRDDLGFHLRLEIGEW